MMIQNSNDNSGIEKGKIKMKKLSGISPIIVGSLLSIIPIAFITMQNDATAQASEKKPVAPQLVYSYVYSYATCTKPHQLPYSFGVASEVFTYCLSGDEPRFDSDALESIVKAANANCVGGVDLVISTPTLVEPHANKPLAEQDKENTCTQNLGGGCIGISWKPSTFYSGLNSNYKKSLKNCVL